MEGEFVECVCISGCALYVAVLTHVDAQEGELSEDAVYGCKFLGMKTKDQKKTVFIWHTPKKKSARRKQNGHLNELNLSQFSNLDTLLKRTSKPNT